MCRLPFGRQGLWGSGHPEARFPRQPGGQGRWRQAWLHGDAVDRILRRFCTVLIIGHRRKCWPGRRMPTSTDPGDGMGIPNYPEVERTTGSVMNAAAGSEKRPIASHFSRWQSVFSNPLKNGD
jgi:hypothetical protein